MKLLTVISLILALSIPPQQTLIVNASLVETYSIYDPDVIMVAVTIYSQSTVPYTPTLSIDTPNGLLIVRELSQSLPSVVVDHPIIATILYRVTGNYHYFPIRVFIDGVLTTTLTLIN